MNGAWRTALLGHAEAFEREAALYEKAARSLREAAEALRRCVEPSDPVAGSGPALVTPPPDRR